MRGPSKATVALAAIVALASALTGLTALPTDALVTNQYSSGALAPTTCPITDLATTNCAEVTVPDTNVVTDVRVGIRITHTFVGDLTISLESPEGTEVNLVDINGSHSQDDYGQGSGCDGPLLWFDDAAATNITAATFADGLNGTFQPQASGTGALASFDGERGDGTWTLNVRDDFLNDSGQVDCYVVELQQAEPSVTVDKTVGTQAATCATTSDIDVVGTTDVYYCYTLTNTGDIALDWHDLTDSELGDVLTLAGMASPLNQTLIPGNSIEIITPAVSIDGTVANTVTYDAWNEADAEPVDEVSATDGATVMVGQPTTTTTTTAALPVAPATSAATQAVATTPTFTG